MTVSLLTLAQERALTGVGPRGNESADEQGEEGTDDPDVGIVAKHDARREHDRRSATQAATRDTRHTTHVLTGDDSATGDALGKQSGAVFPYSLLVPATWPMYTMLQVERQAAVSAKVELERESLSTEAVMETRRETSAAL